MNRVYFGDNLPILASLPSASVALIYIDPPFNTGKAQARTQIKTVRSDDGDRTGFKGQRYKTVRIGQRAFADTFSSSEEFLAFLDIHPQSPGHVQVVPKTHYRWIWDVPNIGQYFEVARKIAKAEQKAFSTDWILTKSVGDEISHAHIWVFPNDQVAGDKMDFTGNAAKIRAHLP